MIATRRLKVIGGRSTVTVRIGQPRRTGRDWLCPFAIADGTGKGVQAAYGADSIQALQLALEAIRLCLLAHPRPLTWLDLPDLGLGRAVPIVIGPRRVARLNRAIDRETERWTRERKREG